MCRYTPPAHLTLASHPTSVAKARAFLREHRCPQHDAEVTDTAALLVSELVTNAVRHAAPPITLEVECRQRHDLNVRVSDASPESPQVGLPPPEAEGGRGMAILDLLSDDWGTEPHDDGKAVWFSLVPGGNRVRATG